MVNLLLNYLLESSLCLIVFSAAYKLLITNLTLFNWMRFYLITSLIFSLVLPFIAIPVNWNSTANLNESITHTFIAPAKQAFSQIAIANPISTQQSHEVITLQLILNVIFAIYLFGIIFKSFLLAKKLKNITEIIRRNSKIKEQNYWLVSITNQLPAFSFLNYIFINKNYKNLSATELQIIKNHEIEHIKQYHTLDILFVELLGILFWFNPAIYYLRKSLKEIHEYCVDEKIAGLYESKKNYAQLLLRLATQTKGFDLATSFTGITIKRRILMIAKPRTSAPHKLKFIIIAPLTFILLFTFSCGKDSKVIPNVKIDSKDWTNKSPFALQQDLKKYCGTYAPLITDTMLRPMEILNIDNKLFRFIEAESKEENRTVEIQFHSTNKYVYTDFSGRAIEFIVDSNNVVTGCILTRKDGTYKLFKENC